MNEFQIAKLGLRAGDVLVVKVDRVVSDEMAARIKAMAADALPPDVKTLVIDRQIDLAVLTAEEIHKRVAA